MGLDTAWKEGIYQLVDGLEETRLSWSFWKFYLSFSLCLRPITFFYQAQAQNKIKMGAAIYTIS